MKCLRQIATVLAMLTVASMAWATPVTGPPPSMYNPGAATEALPPPAEWNRWSAAVQVASWTIPTRTVDGYEVKVNSKERPLVALEYQLDDRWAVGGWYNWISWEILTKNPATGAVDREVSDGAFLGEVHATRDLGRDWYMQFGYQRLQGQFRTHNDLHWLGLWGMKVLPLSQARDRGLRVTLAAGLSAPLSGYTVTKSQGATMLHAAAIGSYAFTPTLSLEVAAWALDFNGDNRRYRFTSGISGRF